MDEALKTVLQVGTLVDEINSGAAEQLLGILQVDDAATQLDGITQQNAAMVEQLASSGGLLQAQAQTVAEAVAVIQCHRRSHRPRGRMLWRCGARPKARRQRPDAAAIG